MGCVCLCFLPTRTKFAQLCWQNPDIEITVMTEECFLSFKLSVIWDTGQSMPTQNSFLPGYSQLPLRGSSGKASNSTGFVT